MYVFVCLQLLRCNCVVWCVCVKEYLHMLMQTQMYTCVFVRLLLNVTYNLYKFLCNWVFLLMNLSRLENSLVALSFNRVTDKKSS